MLGAAAHGLHRGPHVTVARHQVPTRRHKFIRFNSATGIHRFEIALDVVRQGTGPDHIAIALYHGVRSAQFRRFLRIERRVNSAENDSRALCASRVADLISPQSVAGVNTDAHHIPSLDGGHLYRLQGLIHKVGIPVA